MAVILLESRDWKELLSALLILWKNWPFYAAFVYSTGRLVACVPGFLTELGLFLKKKNLKKKLIKITFFSSCILIYLFSFTPLRRGLYDIFLFFVGENLNYLIYSHLTWNLSMVWVLCYFSRSSLVKPKGTPSLDFGTRHPSWQCLFLDAISHFSCTGFNWWTMVTNDDGWDHQWTALWYNPSAPNPREPYYVSFRINDLPFLNEFLLNCDRKWWPASMTCSCCVHEEQRLSIYRFTITMHAFWGCFFHFVIQIPFMTIWKRQLNNHFNPRICAFFLSFIKV